MPESTLANVIIATLGTDIETLETTIQSVFKQSHKNIKTLVIQDGPLELSQQRKFEDFLKSIEDRVSYILLPERKYANFCRNLGVKNSKGKYIAFLDDDDQWHPEKIEEQIKHLESCSSKFSLVSCALTASKDSYMKKMQGLEGSSTTLTSSENFVDIVLRGKEYWSSSTVLFSQTLFSRIQFDESLKRHQDWDLLFRLSKKVDVCFFYDQRILVYAPTQNLIDKVRKFKNYQINLKALLNWANRLTSDQVLSHGNRRLYLRLHFVRYFWQGLLGTRNKINFIRETFDLLNGYEKTLFAFSVITAPLNILKNRLLRLK